MRSRGRERERGGEGKRGIGTFLSFIGVVEDPVIARANHSGRREEGSGRKPGRAMDGMRNEAIFSAPGWGKRGNVYCINRIGGELQIGFYDLHFVHARKIGLRTLTPGFSCERRRKIEQSEFVWAIERPSREVGL